MSSQHICITAVCLFALVGCGTARLSAQLSTSKTEAPNPHVVQGDLKKVVATLPKGVDIEWIVPPEPSDCEWQPERELDSDGVLAQQWEHSFQVTHIKFDFEKGHANDALDIRWNGNAVVGDLHHLGEGKGSGEFIQPDPKGTPGGGSGPEDGRSDPVLWVAATVPQIKVRIRLRELLMLQPLQNQAPTEVYSAIIRAENVFSKGTVQSAGFMNWKPKRVYFDNKGISRESYDVATGQFGPEEYVTFDLTSTVPDRFGDYIAKYKCYVSKMQQLDQGQWVNVTGQQAEVEFDLLTRIDMYSVLAKPASPWYFNDATHPWVSALGFTNYPCEAAGETNVSDACDAVVEHLFQGHGVEYDHVLGMPSYVRTASKGGQVLFEQLDLTKYMRIDSPRAMLNINPGAKLDVPAVGCLDQASAVATLTNLVEGGSAALQHHKYFGYLKAKDHVGGNKSNNPMFWHIGYDPAALLGNAPDYETDLHYYSPIQNGNRARSHFSMHAYVLVQTNVADATVGPVKIGDGKTLDAYLGDVRDTSTADEKQIPLPRDHQFKVNVKDNGTTHSIRIN